MFESIDFVQNAQFLLRFSAQSGPAGDVWIHSFHSKRSVSLAFQRPAWSSGRCLINSFHSKRSVSIACLCQEWFSGRCLSPFLSFKTLCFFCVSATRVVQREMFESTPSFQSARFLLRFSVQSCPAGDVWIHLFHSKRSVSIAFQCKYVKQMC